MTEPTRRDFLYVATGAAGVVGVAGVAWPLIDQMNPDKSVLALASIEVDLTSIPVGGGVTVKWRGMPVFIRNRPEADIKAMEATPMADLKDPEADSARVKEGHANWLVMIGVCTHLGCIPLFNEGDFKDGWFCPCHGSQYDASGRIIRGPAPKNLVIPPYEFVSDTKIKIG
ncbi:MAG TPA: ubiquinol-cytochrome c reductase iron-sulfur subunit [Devosiaceae bacterium]